MPLRKDDFNIVAFMAATSASCVSKLLLAQM